MVSYVNYMAMAGTTAPHAHLIFLFPLGRSDWTDM